MSYFSESEMNPPPAVKKTSWQEDFCDSMKVQQNTLHAFEHLLRLNRLNNQVFFLREFGHSLNNSINTIQLGGKLLNHYVQDINDLFDELNDDPERPPADFHTSCFSILSSMPQVIQGICDAALRLDHSASSLSKYTGQRPVAAGSIVDINHLVSLSSAMIQHQITCYTNHFRLDLNGSPAVFSGSSEQLSQVIFNLLMNALLSLPDKSCEVDISTSCDYEKGKVLICIRDEGTGMSNDLLPRIVEPFFSTWQEHGCVGIGLTVADHVIRNHGGELSINSEPGKGTTVRVILPYCSSDTLECNHV